MGCVRSGGRSGRVFEATTVRSRGWIKLAIGACLVAIVASLSSPGVGHAVAARSGSHQVEIRRLLDRSGMTETIERFSRSAREQMAVQEMPLESEDEKHVQEIFQAVFAADVIRDHVIDALERDYEPGYVAELERWFESDLGAMIRDEEIRAQSPESTADLMKFAQASEVQSPNPERVELAKQINEARGASKLSVRLVTEILRGMVMGTAVVADVDGKIPTVDELEAVVKQQVGQLESQLEPQMVVSFLFSGRNLSLSDNRKYLEHLQSDAGQWFYARSGDGLVSAMVLAGRAFGNHTSAWVQDLRGAASAEATEARLASAADEGRAYGASKPASSCIDEIERRRRACAVDVCFAESRAFADGCFARAKPDAQACKGVPGTEDLAKTIYWRLSRCGDRGMADGSCDAAMGALQRHCDGGRNQAAP